MLGRGGAGEFLITFLCWLKIFNNTNFHFLTGFIDQLVIQNKIINVKVVELVFWLYDISPCFKLFDESWQRISDFR